MDRSANNKSTFLHLARLLRFRPDEDAQKKPQHAILVPSHVTLWLAILHSCPVMTRPTLAKTLNRNHFRSPGVSEQPSDKMRPPSTTFCYPSRLRLRSDTSIRTLLAETCPVQAKPGQSNFDLLSSEIECAGNSAQ